MDTSPHKSNFVNVNGIRLHYLDWGGEGDVILFLAGMGCNAHIFDHLAPRFTDTFHVMAITRRGHGESNYPETGYDIDTLTEDIRQFLDTLEIDKVILVGHSMASVELSHFAALYPERILKLVFLDAAYDRSSSSYNRMLEKSPLKTIKAPGMDDVHYSPEDYFAAMKRAYPSFVAIWSEWMEEQALHDITQTPEGKVVDKMSDAISTAITNTLTSYVPEDSMIKAPTLSFYTISNECYFLANDWMTEEEKARVKEFFETVNYSWINENIEQFRSNVPHAKIVVIPQGHHYCFIRKEEFVFEEMRAFLLE